MCAFDVFVLPSLYEGFPFVLVEAQANGLKSVVSTKVPTECDITTNVEFLPLEISDERWAKKLMNSIIQLENREYWSNYVRCKGYDLYDNVSKLENYYKSKV